MCNFKLELNEDFVFVLIFLMNLKTKLEIKCILIYYGIFILTFSDKFYCIWF